MFYAIGAGEKFNSWDFNLNLFFNEISLNDPIIVFRGFVQIWKSIASMNSGIIYLFRFHYRLPGHKLVC